MQPSLRLSPHELAEQQRSGRVSIVDVREPMEFVGGSISGSRNIPLAQIGKVHLPDGPLVLVCELLINKPPARLVTCSPSSRGVAR